MNTRTCNRCGGQIHFTPGTNPPCPTCFPAFANQRGSIDSTLGTVVAVLGVLAIVSALVFGAVHNRTTTKTVTVKVPVTKTITKVQVVHDNVDRENAALIHKLVEANDSIQEFCGRSEHKVGVARLEINAAGDTEVNATCIGNRLQEDDPNWDAETMGNGYPVGPNWNCTTDGDRICETQEAK